LGKKEVKKEVKKERKKGACRMEKRTERSFCDVIGSI
jgi:hypothetical protein